jgi:excinuclease ABC subunit C
MGRCIAPCAGGVSADEYSELVKRAARVLSGDTGDIVEELTAEMLTASEEMEFERAAKLRDSIEALRKLSEKQKVVGDEKLSRDVFALATSGSIGTLAMLSVRRGSLINKYEFEISVSGESGAEDAMSLIVAYYDSTGDTPREVMLDFDMPEDDRELLSEYLSLNTPYKVAVRVPERGDARALCKLARSNAEEALRQHVLEGEREDKNIKRLAELLSLSEPPRRIEAYDISNVGNENIVASMVVWADGRLKKSDYRLFNIKSTDGQDDYGSMREALTRRLAHIGEGTVSLGDTPDLLLVDGGDTHVGVAKEVLLAKNLEIPVFGMVKDDYHKTRALTNGDSEISIAKEFDVYAFIYNLQEEAHRFALKTSSGAKRKSLTHSSLEKIEGIGPAKAKKLLSAMPLGKIREATTEELSEISGISRADAERIYKYYHNKK